LCSPVPFGYTWGGLMDIAKAIQHFAVMVEIRFVMRSTLATLGQTLSRGHSTNAVANVLGRTEL
jgi:hypothetical protein